MDRPHVARFSPPMEGGPPPRLRCALLLALLVVAICLPSAQADATRFRDTRYRAPDENYLVGYFTWDASQKGGVSWDPASTSRDPGGPTSNGLPSDQNRAAWTHFALTGDDSRIRREVYTSSPVPQTLFLNASRHIEVDFVKASAACCPRTAIQLFVNETFLGGMFWNQVFHPEHKPAQPSDGVISHRIQPELASIPQGAILRVHVLHLPGDRDDMQWRMAGPFRSVVRIPFFPPEEQPFRLPQYQSSEEDSAAEGATATARVGVEAPRNAALALPLVGVLGLAGLRRVGRRPLAVLLVVALASGCLAGGGPTTLSAEPSSSPQGSITGGVLPNATSHQADEGLGDVVGVVHDDQDVPVVGAHVAILTSSNSTTTAGYGQFSILGLPAGEHRVRVDKEGYHSLEEGFTVEAGRVTRLEITMVSLFAGDRRPHRHDYWGAETTKTAFEGNVALGSSLVLENCPAAQQEGCLKEFRIPREAVVGEGLVLPGTYEVEVVVTWNPTRNRVWGVGLGFEDNGDPGFVTQSGQYIDNATFLYPRGESGSAVFHVQTAWEMTDIGHQTYSTWVFFLYLPPVVDVLIDSYSGNDIQDPFHVTVLLHKGVVPLEPAHRDFWGEKDSLVVADKAQLPIYCGSANSAACPRPTTLPRSDTGWRTVNLVPPQTASLRLVLEIDKESTPTAYDWTLRVKPANVPPPDDATDFSGYQTLQATQNAPLRKEFTLTIRPEEADAFYSRKSNWHYVLDDQSAAATSIDNGPIVFTLTVTAVRDDKAPATAGLLNVVSK